MTKAQAWNCHVRSLIAPPKDGAGKILPAPRWQTGNRGWAILSALFAFTAPCFAGASGHYETSARTLVVSVDGKERFRYVFNKGGAINGIFDLAMAPEVNLVGPSFQGETTDRVIQWTYWNRRYKAPENPVGDHDRRANVTMEGSFGEAATCEALNEPPSCETTRLEFTSRIQHWFYANLDTHGTPDFTTHSTYEVLPEGSLRLTRRVMRAPWRLKEIEEETWDGTAWRTTRQAAITMRCEHYWPRSQTSYFEAWCPLRWEPLPRQKHGRGEFTRDGYQFWEPAKLGGWAMAYGEHQAVAIVFGSALPAAGVSPPRAVFNKLLQPKANLNILLPAVETSWPEGHTLIQVLIIVPGAPAEVELRARRWQSQVPAPVMAAPEPTQPH